LKDHLLAGARQGHATALHWLSSGPPLPPAVAHIWAAFIRLHNRRGGGMGPAPLMWTEIEAFARLTGASFDPWELELIEALDNVFARVRNDDGFEFFADEA